MRSRGATPGQIETLYRQRFEHFVRVAAAICGSPELAHDVVQNAFIAAIRNRRSFRAEGSLESWVWRIVVNEARHARPQLAVATSDQLATDSANGHGESEEDPLELRARIAALPERQREAVFLRYFADLDYRTISTILEIEVGTVSATLGAAHRALRKKLTEARQ